MRRCIWSVLVFLPLILSASTCAGEKQAAADDSVYQGRTLAEWIEDLKNPDEAKRTSAAEALAVFGSRKEVVSALATALKDETGAVLVYAAQTLGSFGPKAKDALPALRAAFKRKDDLLHAFVDTRAGPQLPRQVIAEALIRIDEHPGPDFAPIFKEALRVNEFEKRRSIAAVLGKLGPDAARTTVPILIELLSDRNAEVAIEAAKSLGRLGSAARPALHALTLALKRAAPEKTTSVQQMEVSTRPVASGAGNVRTIAFTPITGNSVMLRACAAALGRIHPEARGTVAALRLALRDLDEGVRWAALCALLESGQDTKEVVPILRNLLGDKSASVRRMAVEALGKSTGAVKEILPSLLAALKDEDASVRESAVKTVGDKETEAKQAIPALLAALKDAAANVRSEAAVALGKSGAADDKVITALIAALEDREDRVVEAAGKVLASFGARAKAAIPVLLPRLESSDPGKRCRCCVLLARFGPAAKDASAALEKISSEDPEAAVRLVALTTLAKIDSSRVKDTVRRLAATLEDKREDVSGAALECLEFLGPDAREALPALYRLREKLREKNVSVSGIDDAIEAIKNPKEKTTDR